MKSYLDMLKAAEERLLLCEISEKSLSSSLTGKKVKEVQDAKEAKEVTGPLRHPSSYAHPWPDAIERLGPRRVGAFAACEGSCGRWSWVRYGVAVLCLPCVRAWIGDEEEAR